MYALLERLRQNVTIGASRHLQSVVCKPVPGLDLAADEKVGRKVVALSQSIAVFQVFMLAGVELVYLCLNDILGVGILFEKSGVLRAMP